MRGKVEDTIPTCQYGNRHILIEFTDEKELQAALSKLDELSVYYHNYVGKELADGKM